MKKKLLLLLILFPIFSLLAETEINAGYHTGHWTLEGSPYLIIGEIIIPNTGTITIDPGVVVEFQGHHELKVKGQLLAVGTLQDSITFTVADTTGYNINSHTGWHGIKFENTATTNDSSKFYYCKFEYAKGVGEEYDDGWGGAIKLHSTSKVHIAFSTFRNNYATTGAGIYCTNGSSPLIEYNIISHNLAGSEYPGGGSGGGIAIYWCSAPMIRNNIISYNRAYTAAGIRVATDSQPFIYNNIISNNSAIDTGGIQIYGAAPQIFNNLIYDNHTEFIAGGISCETDSMIVIANNTIVGNSSNLGGGLAINGNNINLVNNIIWDNTSQLGNQVFFRNQYSNQLVNFFNCDIQGGIEEFGYEDDASFAGEYLNCIDLDPLFVNQVSREFQLLDSSPCIGAGLEELSGEGFNFNVVDFDFFETPRPSPVGSMPDIGAIENILGDPVGFSNNVLPMNSFNLTNHPNPFNPNTVISFELNTESTENTEIEIYNVKGQSVVTLSDPIPSDRIEGRQTHTVTWNGTDQNNNPVASGIYFLNLKISNEIMAVNKCLLIK